MNKLLIALSCFAFLLVNVKCADRECGECFTPPDFFVFEVVDKSSGENLFTNGTYDSNELVILDSSDNEVEFTFISEDNINLIQVYTIGWKTEIVNYRINVASKNIFDLYVDAKRLSEDCCSFTRYNKIEISNAEYVRDSNTGIYKILVE